MLKRILSLLFAFFCSYSYAQEDSLIRYDHIVNGKNELTGEKIKSRKCSFDGFISNVFLDTIQNTITIQTHDISNNDKRLKQFGDLILCNAENMQIKWHRRMHYLTDAIVQNSNLLIFTRANKGHAIDLNTGEDKWNLYDNIFYVDPNLNIGLGCRSDITHDLSDQLEGIDLTDGSRVWKRRIMSLYGWHGMTHLSDNIILVIAGGLHTVDVKTGEGWDYHAKMSENDPATPFAINEAFSNILLKDGDIYFASASKISRIGTDGSVKWTKKLDRKQTSRSSIFEQGNTIYMVNYGLAYQGIRPILYGQPFIAAFNKETGDQLYQIPLGNKETRVHDYVVKNDLLYVLFKNKIFICQLNNGTILKEAQPDTKETGDMVSFIGDNAYVNETKGLHRLADDDSKTYIVTSKSVYIALDEAMNYLDTVNAKQLYFNFHTEKGYKFLCSTENTIIVNDANRTIANIESSHPSVIDNKLYSKYRDYLTETDLGFLKK